MIFVFSSEILCLLGNLRKSSTIRNYSDELSGIFGIFRKMVGNVQPI